MMKKNGLRHSRNQTDITRTNRSVETTLHSSSQPVSHLINQANFQQGIEKEKKEQHTDQS